MPGKQRLRPPLRAHDVPGLASTSASDGTSRSSRRSARRASTARPTPTAPTTSRSCRRTSSRPRCGSRATAWATCSTAAHDEEPRQPDRRRPQRAPPALRQRAVRQGAVRACTAALYPEGHPYRYLTIGKHEDLDGRVARRREGLLQDLVRAGERDPGARRRLRRRRGQEAGREVVRRRSRRARSRRSCRCRRRRSRRRGAVDDDDFAKLRRITFAWHSPANFAPRRRRARHRGERAAQEGPGRLYRALVYDRPIAQSVRRTRAASQFSGHLRRSRSRCAARPTSPRSRRSSRAEVARLGSEPLTAANIARVVTQQRGRGGAPARVGARRAPSGCRPTTTTSAIRIG